MVMTSSRSARTIDLNDTLCPEIKKPQDAVDSCGCVVAAIGEFSLLAIAGLPGIPFVFEQKDFQ
jgi:hypothetical protein